MRRATLIRVLVWASILGWLVFIVCQGWWGVSFPSEDVPRWVLSAAQVGQAVGAGCLGILIALYLQDRWRALDERSSTDAEPNSKPSGAGPGLVVLAIVVVLGGLFILGRASAPPLGSCSPAGSDMQVLDVSEEQCMSEAVPPGSASWSPNP